MKNVALLLVVSSCMIMLGNTATGRTNFLSAAFPPAPLLAMDERYLASHGLSSKNIRVILPVAGAYDINHYHSFFLNNEDPNTRTLADTHVKDVFGDTEADFTDASPSSYMDGLNMPMLIVSDRALYLYTKVFEEKLREAGYQNGQVLHVFNFNHGGLWRDISNAPNSQTRNMMIEYIRRNALL